MRHADVDRIKHLAYEDGWVAGYEEAIRRVKAGQVKVKKVL